MKQRLKINGAALKIIAIIAMTIDHIGVIFIERNYETYMNPVSVQDRLLLLDKIMRGIGRLAFPLFVFLMVEGFCHTKNVKKYIGRMAAFALLSEIPFDLAFYNRWFFFYYNNVFITLAIGLAVLALIRHIQIKYAGISSGGSIARGPLIMYLEEFIVIITGSFLAEVLYSDYGGVGVCAVACAYLLRHDRLISYMVPVCLLTVALDFTEIYALAGAVFVYYYDGSRGKQFKYFFYAYYPLHLLLLWMIK